MLIEANVPKHSDEINTFEHVAQVYRYIILPSQN